MGVVFVQIMYMCLSMKLAYIIQGSESIVKPLPTLNGNFLAADTYFESA